MEIYIHGIGSGLTDDETRLKLISEVSSVVHHPPLYDPRISSPTNFDISLQHQTKGPKYNKISISHWYLTFPSIPFAQSFLDHLSTHTNTRASIFGPRVRFYQSTTQLGSQRIPKVPHPGLVFLLKSTVFRNPEAERALAAEAKQIAGLIPIDSIQFGRITLDQCFAAEIIWDMVTDGVSERSSLKWDSQSASILITIDSNTHPPHQISIAFKIVERIEADEPSIILFLSSPPVLSELPQPTGDFFARVSQL